MVLLCGLGCIEMTSKYLSGHILDFLLFFIFYTPQIHISVILVFDTHKGYAIRDLLDV
jgi:hypothetical protein